ncbi:MAG: resA1 [Frankiales bacterium]|nr:resA1 [Frankiales bacterium]
MAAGSQVEQAEWVRPPAADAKANPVLSTLRSRRFTAFVLVIVVTAAVGETLMTLRQGSAPTDVRPGTVYVQPGKRSAVQLPEINLLGGDAFDRSSVSGRVTVVNFWASWCAPCYREAQTLQQVARETESAGVAFVGVDAQESAAGPGLLFVKDRGVEYPNVFDPDGVMQLAFARSVQLGSLPVTVILDRSGRVAGIVYGEAKYTDLSALVNTVAGEA